ncbi:hypothetical protein DL93DRAFT_2097501 [Clavulina sp. PMI_390]|nr:hypothetical protein DL93DRAFT_2097501 [Clavulina sp. PMI_390]
MASGHAVSVTTSHHKPSSDLETLTCSLFYEEDIDPSFPSSASSDSLPVPSPVPGLELSGHVKPSTIVTIHAAGHRFSQTFVPPWVLSAKPFAHFADETIINVEIEAFTEENKILHRRFLISAKPEGKIACLFASGDPCDRLSQDLTLQEQAVGLWRWSSPTMTQPPVRRKGLCEFFSLRPKSAGRYSSNELSTPAATHSPTPVTDPQELASTIALDQSRSWFIVADSAIPFDNDLGRSPPLLVTGFSFPARLYDEVVPERPRFAGCCPRSGTWAYTRAIVETSCSPLPSSHDGFVSFTILKYD